MERKEINQKVKDFLVDEFEIEESVIRPEARLREDIGIDSLDFVDIVVLVDREFGFRIVPEELASVITLQDFCDYIERKVNQK
ncbi:MAG: acyl carrier protein [Paludibacteraceae bacterium]|nr:acyl carrier protein [Paludibacteraceae bacterium]